MTGEVIRLPCDAVEGDGMHGVLGVGDEVRDGLLFALCVRAWGGELGGVHVHTSATSAERAVAVAALGANPNHLAVNVLSVVGVDVARAAAPVRDFGSHFEELFDERNVGISVGSSGYLIYRQPVV